MDDDGFREFVTLRYTELLRTAHLLAGGRYDAEDLLHTAFLRVMRRWSRIEDPMAYLRRAMVNQLITVWRRPARLREGLTAIVPEPAATGDGAEAVARRQDLLAVLGELPHRMRAVLVLRYWEDLSEERTAQLLGCSVGSVKSQASRGLARVRSVLLAQVATGEGSKR